MDAPPDLAAMSLTEVARALAEQRLPPVDRWNPSHCGDSDMRIARDGVWYHQGSPIGRLEMVRLFATILRREPDGGYVLVTPSEKLTIEVEDAPFVAVELKSEGEGPHRQLAFRLNTGELVVAGADNALRFDTRDEACPERLPQGDGRRGPHPYLHVRGGLEALVARPVYYELAEMALAEANGARGVWSGGIFFAMDA